MRHHLFALLLVLLVLPAAVSGLVSESNGTVVIDRPVSDDVIASGGMVIIDAPVQSLIAAGGTVEINGPVEGDVIAAGGQVVINGDIGGKAVIAGGSITVNGNISRNLIAYGGEVVIGPTSTIGKDASISGGTVVNRGHVGGTLHVSAEQVENPGTAGATDIMIDTGDGLDFLFTLIKFAFVLGMLILGILLVTYTPRRFLSVADDIRNSPLLDFAIGIGGLLAGAVLFLLLIVTLIGIPFAILLMVFYIGAVLLSTLFVSMALGSTISNRLHRDLKNWQKFLAGFIPLYILFLIPFAGTIIMFVAVCLGLGGILHMLFRKKSCILENST